MTNSQLSLNEQELIEIRKLAIQIASKHDENYVVGISTLIFNAKAICDYLLAGKLPDVNVPMQP